MPRTSESPRAGGTLVAIVGRSGVGKDSLIAYSRARLNQPSIHFVRRCVTRPATAGGETHTAMSDREFEQACRDGRFAVTWRAHDLSYGVPVEALHHARQGGVAVLNASRAALADIKRVFGKILVVEVTADPALLAGRLTARGRETGAGIDARLKRQAAVPAAMSEVLIIDNSGPLEKAGEQLVAAIRAL